MTFFNKISRRANVCPTPPTREELYIKDYLDGQGFKYIREFKIDNLNFDNKSYRKVDFYLPRLHVFVEYFGMYNANKSSRESYDEKLNVYFKNHMPTIVLYPHELGFIDYAFHKKMLTLLKMPKFKKKSNIFRYKLSRYFHIGRGYYFFVSIVSLMLAGFALVNSQASNDFNFMMFLVLFLTSAFFIIHFFYWIIMVFVYEY